MIIITTKFLEKKSMRVEIIIYMKIFLNIINSPKEKKKSVNYYWNISRTKK